MMVDTPYIRDVSRVSLTNTESNKGAGAIILQITGETRDGYHTFNELYYHRMVLFATICNAHKQKAWKSWLHDDGTMFDDYFVTGIETAEGHYTYHYHKDHWDMFDVIERELAPEWDGHKPEDITRLLTLV